MIPTHPRFPQLCEKYEGEVIDGEVVWSDTIEDQELPWPWKLLVIACMITSRSWS